MYKENGNIIYSPTDLSKFMNSPFAAWMNRLALEQPAKSPEPDSADQFTDLLAKRGLKHEQNIVDEFIQQQKTIINLSGRYNTFKEHQQKTIDAMHAGIDVIYQAALEKMPFRGYADFLIKVTNDEGQTSIFGDYHYTVYDSKLASQAKPEFVLQLCCYADMLELIQHIRPSDMALILANQTLKLSTNDYFFYYLANKDYFLNTEKNFQPNQLPDPANSQNHGQWTNYAKQLIIDQDHLAIIANITNSQIKKLKKAGINTCEKLVNTKKDNIAGLKKDLYHKLKKQAHIQNLSKGLSIPKYEIIESAANRQQGLVLLPPSNSQDIFFDIEGFPLLEGGLEYLWGASFYGENKKIDYIDFWAHNPTEEKQAFSDFIHWAYARWLANKDLHIYHYGHYEIAAIRRLMSRYGVCEHAVDNLLRHEVFVDLYKIVKNGLFVGEPKYSIKNIEHLYRSQRQTDVSAGSDSVVAYEQWRELNAQGLDGNNWQHSTILKSIRDYNIDDCDSTLELTEWLRQQQQAAKLQYQEPSKNVTEINDEPSETSQFRDKLLKIATKESEDIAKISNNLAWLLEFHQREAKPIFWKLYDRLGTTSDELYNDIECLTDCQRTSRTPFKATSRARNLSYEYTFDTNQEFKGHSTNYHLLGQYNTQGQTIKVTLVKEHSKLNQGIITVSCKNEPPSLITLIPDDYVNPEPMPSAIKKIAVEHQLIKSQTSALKDILQQANPRFKVQIPLSELVNHEQPAQRLKQIIKAVHQLDCSYLIIQGPPGAGKTYTAKHIITSLLQENKRIAISSNSHKAINNLLKGVIEQCKEENISSRFFASKIADTSLDSIELIKNNQIKENLNQLSHTTQGCVVGTTAWGFSRDDVINEFDYLFIDEAGQVSLANLVAMSRCANNIILMGDQMQLSQPSQGAHPEESGLSALDYLLKNQAIIDKNKGIFLNTTYRMHPAVNQFISQAIYQNKLNADKDNAKQVIDYNANQATALPITAGVIFIPVEHQGNTQHSSEEIEQIEKIANDLIGNTYTDKAGKKHLLTYDHMLFMAPFNHQVNQLQYTLGHQAQVGSVDKFQGQEAPIVFYSLCSSDARESARGIDFLFDIKRVNVALSRAKCLAIVVGQPQLFITPVNHLTQMKKINTLARLREYIYLPL